MIDSLILNLPNDQLLSIARDFRDGCALCGCHCPDNDSHYLTCDFVLANETTFKALTAIPQIATFRRKFRHDGAWLKSKLLSIINEAYNEISKKRSFLSRDVIETLLFTYLSELAARKVSYNPDNLTVHIDNLPSCPRNTPPQIIQLNSSQKDNIFRNRRVPLDFIFITDLGGLPNTFCRWHFVRSGSARAIHFGEVLEIESSHHDLTFWFVVNGPCRFFAQAIDIAMARVKVGGRTWVFHDPCFHFGRWGHPAPSHVEILSFPCGDLRVTVIQRKTLDQIRFFSFPVRITRALDCIRELSPVALLFPFLGLGRFNYIIPDTDIPMSLKSFIQDCRSQFPVDFLLGFFSKAFSNKLSSPERKKLREILFQKAIPILRLAHSSRLDWYRFLRKRYNLFPPRKSPKRNILPAKRKRQYGDDRLERVKRLRLP